MKNLKKLLTLTMILCLILGLCACGNNAAGETTGSTQEPSTDGQNIPNVSVDDGKAAYTVKVIDENGDPLSGVMVQICKDTCLPGSTNDEGVATFNVLEEDGYKVSFMVMPAGYTADAEEFYFEAGSTEMTITLKAAA